MLVSTTEFIPGFEVAEVLGVAKGNTIRAKHIGKDIDVIFRQMVGGELVEYTEMMAESREQANDRMVADARAMGADAVIGMRFTTSMVMQGSAEILAFGTAVKIRKVGSS